MTRHNRYTPSDQQESLSELAKGEHLLLYGTLSEKLTRLKNNIVIALQIRDERIANNIMIRSAKKNFIHHLILLYANQPR